VFESLDRESNGFLTPVEFNAGLGKCAAMTNQTNLHLITKYVILFLLSRLLFAGELMGPQETTELSLEEAEEDGGDVDWSQDPTAVRFISILMELGADKLFKE